MLNAKSAVLRITVISDLLFTSNIGHTEISYSSLNKTDIQRVQHKPDAHTWRMYVKGTRGHMSMKLYTTCFSMRGTMLHEYSLQGISCV